MFKARKEAWMWSGILVLLLLSLITPLSFITISCIMIPALILYIRLENKAFVMFYTISLLLVLLITGSFSVFIIPIALFFLLPVLVLGRFYRKKAPAGTAITAGIVCLLAQLLFVLVVLALWGVDINTALSNFIRQNMNQVPASLQLGLSDEIISESIRMMVKRIPVYLIFISFYYIVITHWLGRKILNRLGEGIPGLRPIREWMLPKSLVWYYLAALIISFFVSSESESIVNMILINLIPLLMFTFSVQAVSFLFFIAHHKKWNKTLPITGIVMLLFLPNILSLLGVFDVAFDLRTRFKTNKL